MYSLAIVEFLGVDTRIVDCGSVTSFGEASCITYHQLCLPLTTCTNGITCNSLSTIWECLWENRLQKAIIVFSYSTVKQIQFIFSYLFVQTVLITFLCKKQVFLSIHVRQQREYLLEWSSSTMEQNPENLWQVCTTTNQRTSKQHATSKLTCIHL